MEQDIGDRPNSSYAYGNASGESSWNPALRPESDTNADTTHPNTAARSSPAFDQKTSTSQSINGSPEVHHEPVPHTNGWEVEEAPNSQGTPGGDENGVPDDFGDTWNQHPETAVSHSVTSPLPETAEPHWSSEEDGVAQNGTSITPKAPAAAEHYEHQGEGETTVLEDALMEHEEAPLVSDPGTATDDWGASREVFDLGGRPEDAPMSTGPVESVVATTGDPHTQNIGAENAGPPDIDWGATDDVDIFGSHHNQQATLEATQEAHTEGKDKDVSKIADSLWDLSLDDDFLPDTEDTATPFDLDDDGFLEDTPGELTVATSASASSNRYAPASSQTSVTAPATNPYAPQAPQFTDLSHQGHQQRVPTANIAYGGYGQPSPYQQQQDRPSMPSSAQSFAAKSKGGYHSPFDLPEDIVAHRKRPPVHHAATVAPVVQPGPAPPRASSLYSNTSAGAPRPPPPSNISVSSLSPPSSSHSMKSPLSGMATTDSQKPTTPKSASSEFFAELPITTKPKPHSGRYAPQNPAPVPPPVSHGPPQLPPKERQSSWSSLRNEVFPGDDDLVSQLRQPEKLPAFPEAPAALVRSQTLPVPLPPSAPLATSRYSPAPPSTTGSVPPAVTSRYSPAPPAPPASSRYSPAPPQASTHTRYASEPPAGPPRPPAQPFAPRTSSPLAYHTVSQEDQASAPHKPAHQAPPSGHQMMQSVDGVPRLPVRHLEEVSEVEEQELSVPQHSQPVPAPSTATGAETPPHGIPLPPVGSPRKTSNYAPQHASSGAPPAAALNFPPPKRSQTQSPTAAMKYSPRVMSSERPSSAHAPLSPPSAFGASQPSSNAANTLPSRRQPSHDFQYIVPQDERASDPLERWKGYPIFKWGLGGTVITSFPKQIPRFGGGASVPMMKCSPGEVKIQNIKDTLPLQDDVVKFPGPLKSKGKKKEVFAWLGRRIEALESELKHPGLEQTLAPEQITRLEEKVMLWKILQILVDQDGHLEGTAATESAVRKVLSADGVDSSESGSSFTTAADLVGSATIGSSAVQAEPVDPQAVQELRSLLTKGDREKAVWRAVDHRLWAHAMLLSSTLSKDIWKQVVQEFVRKEVKKMGGNNQPLAVLYEIFAGNWEECIDELVPASARAGFQMISTDGNGSNQNVHQGLDKWRETLSLILSNRSENDVQALLSLGRLLSGYGRVEAAHICFLFARSTTHVGGLDDPQSDVVLIGADHKLNPSAVGLDLEPILMTEIYEFALSLSAPGGSHVIPHLQNYKLLHAYSLAECGHKSEAQQYCDAIASAMKATTRISPYYNGAFIASLDDLSKRLSQSPKDGSSSWISKPSMDKVSGSLLAKFNSFIAGDDEDATSNHSGAGNDVGPFAKIAGNTPTISPSPSNADLYGTYGSYGGAPVQPPANSRYAPTNQFTPRSSLDQARSRYEPSGRPSLESNDSSDPRRGSEGYMLSPQMSAPSQYSPPLNRTQSGKAQTYAPLKSEGVSPVAAFGGYMPTPPLDQRLASSAYEPPQANFDEHVPDSKPPSMGYEPPSSSYEPPTSSWEPPSYEPYRPDDSEESPVEQKKEDKKKSFMDDDDDELAARSATLKKQQKSEADRIAEENFRKAAEADAKKAAEQKKGGGWFGGWFKKDPNAAPGPIKAKLGEENSFYYDPDLKKWVNKKAGATASASSPTPPPPRSGPPSRNVSGMSVASATPALGSSLPNAMSTPSLGAPPTSDPQRSASMPPPMYLPHSRASTPGVPSDTEGGSKMPPPLQRPILPSGGGPPSRPSTGMSNASSIDDLLGAPQARKGGTVKKGKRGGRYVDVMAQKQ